MVNFDTLATYALQRFYSSLDNGKILTAFGVLKSFATAFEDTEVISELTEARQKFIDKLGVDIVDVMALGLFQRDYILEFEVFGGGVKTRSGYQIYKVLYEFQLTLQELFDRALIGSMKNATGTSGDKLDLKDAFAQLGKVLEESDEGEDGD